MTEEQRAEIKKALIKCAEENEGKNTFTGYVIVSSVCKAGAERIADLEKENTELKEQISTKDILIKELQEQKAYWKESSFDWRHKFFKKGSTKRLVQKGKQLTKAKDHIKKLLDCLKQDTNDPQTNYYVCQYMDKAEQFLNSGVEK